MLKHVINPPPRLACIVINRCTKNTTPNLRIMSPRKQSLRSIHRSTKRHESNPSPLSYFISPRNAGRIDANHIFSQQSTVGRISNRRPIDSSPGDCRQPRIHYFPLDFFEFKGHPPFFPSSFPAPLSLRVEQRGNISWNFSLPVHCERE